MSRISVEFTETMLSAGALKAGRRSSMSFFRYESFADAGEFWASGVRRWLFPGPGLDAGLYYAVDGFQTVMSNANFVPPYEFDYDALAPDLRELVGGVAYRVARGRIRDIVFYSLLVLHLRYSFFMLRVKNYFHERPLLSLSDALISKHAEAYNRESSAQLRHLITMNLGLDSHASEVDQVNQALIYHVITAAQNAVWMSFLASFIMYFVRSGLLLRCDPVSPVDNASVTHYKDGAEYVMKLLNGNATVFYKVVGFVVDREADLESGDEIFVDYEERLKSIVVSNSVKTMVDFAINETPRHYVEHWRGVAEWVMWSVERQLSM